jgi:hypothetical protein
MADIIINQGGVRTRVTLKASTFGDDIVVLIYNENPHVGAVAVGEWDKDNKRASVSLITRLGHKDDAVAQQAAHDISKAVKRPVCVVAGIHLDDITLREIKTVLKNSKLAVEALIRSLAAK